VKKLNLAVSLLAAMVVTSPIYAKDTITATVGVSAYVASGLSIVGTPGDLEFGPVVVPTGTSSSEFVVIDCNGNPSYSPQGDPGDENNGTPSAGSVSISGEPSYYVSITVAADSGTSAPPAGISFAPEVSEADSTQQNGCSTTNLDTEGQLDTDGDLSVVIHGKLTVFNAFDISTNQAINTNAIVTINYR